MIQFNNTNEFNSIKTGDTVYISGLPGRTYKLLNNKLGWIKNIFIHRDQLRLKYTAEVFVPKDNTSYIVDFDYIYRVGGDMNKADISNMVWEADPFTYFMKKNNIVECIPMQDEHGQHLAICTDNQNRRHVFLYSGAN